MTAWRYAAASVAGAAHRAEGRPCEDHAAIRATAEGGLIAVACDGAGSAALGGEGARLACAAFLHYAEANPAPEDGQAWGAAALRAVRADIEQAAATSAQPAAAFACTLLGALATPDVCHFLQVGDGAIAFRPAEGAWRLAIPPQRGEFINETSFVTAPGASAALRVVTVPEPPAALALMTDGVEFLAIRQATLEPHAAFFDHVFGGLQPGDGPGEATGHAAWLQSFLGSPEADARTDDDKTIVVARRTP